MKFLILGATGQIGVLVVREVLSTYPTAIVVLYTRSPQKLAPDLTEHKNCVIVQGDLEDEATLGPALEGVDVVLSAMGPSQFSHPADTPLARGYTKLITVMSKSGVHRLLALGTASMENKSDRFNLGYYGLVKGAAVTMHNAVKDVKTISAVISSSDLPHWSILRVPVLSNNASKDVIAGFIGDGKTNNHLFLNRVGFAGFMVQEVERMAWDKEAPLLVST